MATSTTMTFHPLPLNVTAGGVQRLLDNASARELLLKQVVTQFERKYQCSLEQFERKLDNLELPEHPCWEESIEWRNAVEQLQQIQLSRSIFQWLMRSLTRFKLS